MSLTLTIEQIKEVIYENLDENASGLDFCPQERGKSCKVLTQDCRECFMEQFKYKHQNEVQNDK